MLWPPFIKQHVQWLHALAHTTTTCIELHITICANTNPENDQLNRENVMLRGQKKQIFYYFSTHFAFPPPSFFSFFLTIYRNPTQTSWCIVEIWLNTIWFLCTLSPRLLMSPCVVQPKQKRTFFLRDCLRECISSSAHEIWTPYQPRCTLWPLRKQLSLSLRL